MQIWYFIEVDTDLWVYTPIFIYKAHFTSYIREGYRKGKEIKDQRVKGKDQWKKKA